MEMSLLSGSKRNIVAQRSYCDLNEKRLFLVCQRSRKFFFIILLYSRVEKFLLDERLKSERLSEIDYEYYISSLYEDLKAYLKWTTARFLENKIDHSILDLSLEEESNHEKKNAEDVLKSLEPIVILGEPGSGKTYLLRHLAKKLIESISFDESVRIPIIIKARYWGMPFKTIVDAIYNEIHIFVPEITILIVENELALGRYVILVDGFDEIRNSKNEFLLEIERLVRSRMVKIIITSREANYHGELSAQFHAWIIEKISNEQIDEFAKKVASINNFSYILLEHNLLELARLPLYLIMLCRLGIDNQSQIPNNKAKIQEEFARFLLHKYPHRRNPLFNPAFTLNQKLDFLSMLARRKSIDVGFSDYADCAHEIGLIGDSKLLLNEIIESGLLKGDLSRLDFIHPTIMEFFHARAIASSTPDKIIEFIKERHLQEEYFETVLFLVGQLRDQGNQAIVLDYLEDEDILLYSKCLSARYHIDLRYLLNIALISRNG